MKVELFALALLLVGCGGGTDAYNLFRNSVLDPNLRIHVASFDAADGDKYNNENCNVAAQLFQKQEGVKTRFGAKRAGSQSSGRIRAAGFPTWAS